MTIRNAPATFAAVLVAIPAGVGAVYSLLAAVGLIGPGASGFDLGPVIRVLTSGDTWRGAGWTIATAGIGTAIAGALAALVAVWARGDRVARLLAVLPMAVPHVAAALAALLIFGQSGVLSRIGYALGLLMQPDEFPALVYDRAGFSLVVAFAWKEFPYLALTAFAVLLTRSDDLDDVARTLGATARQTFLRVTWPLLWRGMAPAALDAFAFLLGQYEMPSLLAPSDPTALPLLTYERAVDPNLASRGEAHVLSLLALAIAAGVVTAFVHLRASSEAVAT
jgi:putative spermidine/putrescine transport system permease protein